MFTAHSARIFHEFTPWRDCDRGSGRSSLRAVRSTSRKPGVLGCSFDRLRTSSPCDVPLRYASEPTPCGYQMARLSARSRDTNSSNIRAKRLTVLPTVLAKVWYTRLWKSTINYTASLLPAKGCLLLLPRLSGHLTLCRLIGIDFAHFTTFEEKRCLKTKKLSW
jgi:hypothetical protein